MAKKNLTSFGHKKVRTRAGLAPVQGLVEFPGIGFLPAGQGLPTKHGPSARASETRSRKHCIALLVGKSPLPPLAGITLLQPALARHPFNPRQPTVNLQSDRKWNQLAL